jgi:hypothetical protein
MRDMESIGVRRARAFVVLVGLAVAVAGYFAAQSSVAAPAARSVLAGRSPQAPELEGRLAQTGLVNQLEAALGSAYGGVWLEPATAQLHVGVITPQGRRAAEAAALDVGMAADVVATPVRSSWADLGAAQERWMQRLRAQLEAEAFSSSLSARENTVVLELGSAVSSAERVALEKEAAGAAVDVAVEVLATPSVGFTSWGRCAKFVSFKAYCDPTLVSGASIDNEAENAGKGDCTAGPLVIKKKRATKAAATETFLLTAGHCIVGEGAVGKKWYAFEKQGAPAGRKEIGKALVSLPGEQEAGYDVGMIQVEPPNWAKAKNQVPVVPTIAPWSEGAESEPFPTIKETPPVETAESCYSGQRSGIRCGEIIKTKKIVESENEFGERYEAKEISEIKLTAKGGQGDSGSPAFSKTEYEKSEGFIEGIITGGAAAESEFAYSQTFSFALQGLEGKTGVEYELLRQANEKRHGKLKAGKYPVTIHGTGTSDKFSSEAGSVECKSDPFHAVVSEESSTVTITPEYKECKASFLEASATINMEGCTYVLHVNEKVSTDNYRAESDISCPGGKSIKFTAGTCSWEVKAQTGRETVDLVDDTEASPKDITIRPTLTGIAYTVTKDGLLCPFGGTGEKTNGEYTSGGSTTLTGQSTTNPEEKIAIEITGE